MATIKKTIEGTPIDYAYYDGVLPDYVMDSQNKFFYVGKPLDAYGSRDARNHVITYNNIDKSTKYSINEFVDLLNAGVLVPTTQGKLKAYEDAEERKSTPIQNAFNERLEKLSDQTPLLLDATNLANIKVGDALYAPMYFQDGTQLSGKYVIVENVGKDSIEVLALSRGFQEKDATAYTEKLAKKDLLSKKLYKFILKLEKPLETKKSTQSAQKTATPSYLQESDKDFVGFVQEIKEGIEVCIDNQEKPLTKPQRAKIGEKYGIENQREVKEYTELAIVELAREIALDNRLSPEQKYKKIEKVYQCQPVISEQDSISKSAQQYSTPVPIGYIAGWFTQYDDIDTFKVFEPSAGNGLLTVAYPPQQVTVNELDDIRWATLETQGFASVYKHNAAEPFPTSYQKDFDVILTNPPFGTTDKVNVEGGYKLAGLEHLMAYYALNCMQDKGRAAIIVGGHAKFNPKGLPTEGKEKAFVNYLHSYYNVVDSINIDSSKMYSRQGTSFDVRLILIAGRKENPKYSKPPQDQSIVKSFTELFERVQNAKKYADQFFPLLQSEVDANRTGSKNLGNLDTKNSQNKVPRRTPNVLEAEQVDTSYQGGAKGQLQSGEYSGGTVGGNSWVRNGQRGDSQRDIERGSFATSNQYDEAKGVGEELSAKRPSDTETGGGELLRLDLRGDDDVDKRNLPNPMTETTNPSNPGQDVTVLPYKPFSKAQGEPTLTPVSMATETQKALQYIESKVGNIDAFVAKKLNFTQTELFEVLSNYQIDAVAMSIFNVENGEAMIIGDQTGVGKGRTAAAMIRYASLNGHIPIFLTENKDLFSDLFRDLRDIDTDLKPFILNNDGIIVDKEGDGKVLFRPMKTEEQRRFLENGADLQKAGYDFVLASYSQFASEKRDIAKIQFLLEKSKGNVLILDESHNAGGDGTTSKVLQDAVKNSKGVVYLSATFAKRPDNMPIYAIKTVMNEANIQLNELSEAVKKGGTALQEVIAAQLVEAGQMLRRERSFEGAIVNYVTIGAMGDLPERENQDIMKRHVSASDAITNVMRSIIDFEKTHIDKKVQELDEDVRNEGLEVGQTKGTESIGVDTTTPYFSKVFRINSQMLFAIKALDVADLAIKLSKQGKSVVIGFESTMETMLDDVDFGETIENPDFSTVLQRGLDGVFRITTKLPNGDKLHSNIPLSSLSTQAQNQYRKIQKDIQAGSSGISISPIDTMIKRLQDAGLTVGEMTGRSKVLRFNSDGSATIEGRRDKNKNEITRKFNAGDIDVLLINRSAATGISLHSSKKFKNQKRRAMIIAQPQLDINKEVQMRGRVHRVGQVNAPEYHYVSSAIPAELRLMMMLKKKLKSLDANTTSNQKQSAKKVLESEDFLNKYGDAVVLNYLSENPELNVKLGDPLKLMSKDGTRERYNTTADAAMKVTGRVAILSVAEQEKFYKDILAQYNDTIELLKSTGEYDLEMQALPLNAETKNSRVVVYGTGGRSLFGSDSFLERCEVNVLSKPYTKKELDALIQKSLNGETAEAIQDDLLLQLKSYQENEKNRLEKKHRKKADADMQDEIQKLLKEKEKGQDISEEEKEKLQAKYDRQYEEALKNDETKLDDKVQYFERNFDTFTVGKAVYVPTDLGNTGEVDKKNQQFSQKQSVVSRGIFLGFDLAPEATNTFAPSKIKAKFAVLDSRKYFSVPLSKKDIMDIVWRRSYAIDGADAEKTINDWDKIQEISNSNRREVFIVTGNLLQAAPQNPYNWGKFTDYTLKSGGSAKGILMPNWYVDEATDSQGRKISDDFRKVVVPISKAIDVIKGLVAGQSIATSDGAVEFQRLYEDAYKIVIPQAKQKGGDYYLDKDLLDLVQGNTFQKYANVMQAKLPTDNIADFVGVLQIKFRQSVELSEKQAGNIPTSVLNKPADNVINIPDYLKTDTPQEQLKEIEEFAKIPDEKEEIRNLFTGGRGATISDKTTKKNDDFAKALVRNLRQKASDMTHEQFNQYFVTEFILEPGNRGFENDITAELGLKGGADTLQIYKALTKDQPQTSPTAPDSAWQARKDALNPTKRNNWAEVKVGDFVFVPSVSENSERFTEGFVDKIEGGRLLVLVENSNVLEPIVLTSLKGREKAYYLQPQKQEPTPKPAIKEVREKAGKGALFTPEQEAEVLAELDAMPFSGKGSATPFINAIKRRLGFKDSLNITKEEHDKLKKDLQKVVKYVDGYFDKRVKIPTHKIEILIHDLNKVSRIIGKSVSNDIIEVLKDNLQYVDWETRPDILAAIKVGIIEAIDKKDVGLAISSSQKDAIYKKVLEIAKENEAFFKEQTAPPAPAGKADMAKNRATRLASLPNTQKYLNLKTDNDMSIPLLNKILKATGKGLSAPYKKEIEQFQYDVKNYREADMQDAEIVELETTQVPDGESAPFNSLAALSDMLDGTFAQVQAAKEGAKADEEEFSEVELLEYKIKALTKRLAKLEGEDKELAEYKIKAFTKKLNKIIKP